MSAVPFIFHTGQVVWDGKTAEDGLWDPFHCGPSALGTGGVPPSGRCLQSSGLIRFCCQSRGVLHEYTSNGGGDGVRDAEVGFLKLRSHFRFPVVPP